MASKFFRTKRRHIKSTIKNCKKVSVITRRDCKTNEFPQITTRLVSFTKPLLTNHYIAVATTISTPPPLKKRLSSRHSQSAIQAGGPPPSSSATASGASGSSTPEKPKSPEVKSKRRSIKKNLSMVARIMTSLLVACSTI